MVDSDEAVGEALSEQILEALLEPITLEEKMILLLKYKEKHSLKDIQQTLNLSESAIQMRLKRAREKVNRLYQQQQER